MRRLYAIALFVLMSASCYGAGTYIKATGHLYQAQSLPLTNTVLTFTPTSTPLVDNPLLVSGLTVYSTSTPPVGHFSIDLEHGIYTVIIGGVRRDAFTITIPSGTNETNHIENYITSGATTNFVAGSVSGWTQTAADARYIQKTNSWGTNILITNFTAYADAKLLPGSGASNYVWTLINVTTGQGEWRVNPGAAGGEANTGSNLGVTNTTDKFGIFVDKSGIDLRFRTLRAGANVVLTNEGTNIVIASTAAGGASALETNANQFGAQTILTVKDLPYLTNVTGWATSRLQFIYITNQTRFLGDAFASANVQVDAFWVTNHMEARYVSGSGAAMFDGSKRLVQHADVSDTELGYLNGLTELLTTSIGNLQGGTNGLLTRITTIESATNGLDALTRTKQHGHAVLTNLVGTGAITNLSSIQFTNHGTGTQFLAPWHDTSTRYVFWDDFSRPDSTNVANGGAAAGTTSPSGHPFLLRGPALDNADTNAFIRRGSLAIELVSNPTAGNPTVYYVVTNAQPMSKIGMRATQYDGNGGALLHGLTLAMKPAWGDNTYIIHASADRDGANLQITTNLVADLFTLGSISYPQWTNGQSIVFEIAYLGNNTVWMGIDGTNITVRHPQVDLAFNGSGLNSGTAYYQLSGSATNLAKRSELNSIWGGHVDSYMPGFNTAQFGTRWNGPGADRYHQPEYSLVDGVVITNAVAYTSLNIPNAAAPTTDAFGEIAGDNNAWAASRGAVQWYDGTANTWLVGTLSSDAPSNGQVPKWNTGGTITWEDDTGVGGGEANTIVDLGVTNLATSYSVNSNKVGVAFQFFNLVEGNGITIDQNATGLVFNATAFPDNLTNVTQLGTTNLSTSYPVVSNIVNKSAQLYSMVEGNGVSMDLNATGLVFNVKPQYNTMYVDAGAMVPATTVGATATTEETPFGAYRMTRDYMGFLDTTNSAAHFHTQFPTNWNNGDIKVEIMWATTNAIAASTNVFEISGAAFSVGDHLTNGSWGFTAFLTNHVVYSNSVMTARTQAFAITNTPAAYDDVFFMIRRLHSNAHDIMSGEAKLYRATIQYQEGVYERANF
jgi:hypothetical protein